MFALERLRQATRPLHEEIERRLDVIESVSEEEPRRRLLGRFFGLYRPAEAALISALGATYPALQLENRRKVPFIERDLAALGLSPADIGRLPVCVVGPFPTTMYAFGWCYVVEGATFGGYVIAREARSCGFSDVGLSFFDCYGPRRVELWRQFCTTLEQHLNTSSRAHQAAEGAVHAFETMTAWLCAPLECRSGNGT